MTQFFLLSAFFKNMSIYLFIYFVSRVLGTILSAVETTGNRTKTKFMT